MMRLRRWGSGISTCRRRRTGCGRRSGLRRRDVSLVSWPGLARPSWIVPPRWAARSRPADRLMLPGEAEAGGKHVGGILAAAGSGDVGVGHAGADLLVDAGG